MCLHVLGPHALYFVGENKAKQIAGVFVQRQPSVGPNIFLGLGAEHVFVLGVFLRYGHWGVYASVACSCSI